MTAIESRRPDGEPFRAARQHRSAVRILIVDDHAMVAAGVCAALEDHGFSVLMADCSSAELVVEQARAFGPTTVLLDLVLTGTGISASALIPPLSALGADVFAFTGSSNRLLLATALELGVRGIIHKSASFNDLVDAVRRSEPTLSPSARSQLLTELQQYRVQQRTTSDAFCSLTHREVEVLAMLMKGFAAERIARESFVSLATVRTQIRAILVKLGVTSQLGAVALAYRVGWSPTETSGA